MAATAVASNSYALSTWIGDEGLRQSVERRRPVAEYAQQAVPRSGGQPGHAVHRFHHPSHLQTQANVPPAGELPQSAQSHSHRVYPTRTRPRRSSSAIVESALLDPRARTATQMSDFMSAMSRPIA
jgi:hypothetical protein